MAYGQSTDGRKPDPPAASGAPELADLDSAGLDFAGLFRLLPSPYMVLDLQLNFVEVNDAYCAVTERGRDELIGRNLFDLFPNDGPSGRRLRESLERVLETGRPDSLPLLSYPIRLPKTRRGGFEPRFWSAVHTPLPGPDGRPAYVMQNTVDVTDLQRLKQMAFGGARGALEPGEVVLLQRTREAEAINEALQQETQGLRDLFMQAPGFMAVLAAPDLRFALVNAAYQQLIGHRPLIGRTLEEALPEVAQQGFPALLRQVLRTHEAYIGEATSVLLQRSPDAPLEERFLDFVYQPIIGADGEAWGVFVEGSDVTGRVLAERQQKLLVDELNHRVKNTLASVQAIAAQTLRTTPEPPAFKQAFEARLLALSATHDVLTAAGWRSAGLDDVLKVELNPYGPERCRRAGPPVELEPGQALTLGLIFHELATNAVKYGALSGPGGQVTVIWTLIDDGVRRLELVWRERNGPPVEPPAHRGFGSRLIERSLGADGSSVLDFDPAGLVCRLEMRLTPCA
jgi:PAS domain S-box-containing protein